MNRALRRWVDPAGVALLLLAWYAGSTGKVSWWVVLLVVLSRFEMRWRV